MTYRVVYLGHVARLSGAEIALARVLPALRGRVEAHVILGEDGPLVNRLRKDHISVEVIPLPEAAREVRKDSVRPGAIGWHSQAASAQYVWKLRDRLREMQPDLVHTNSLKSAIYGGVAGRLARIPVIWHIRDRIAPDYLPLAAVRSVRAASRILPTAVIANSRCTLDTLPNFSKGFVIPDSVGHNVVEDAASPLGSTPRPYRVGIVGRLTPWKGQHFFLDAFSRAFPGDDTEAWIVGSAMFGEDDYTASLHAHAERLGLSDRVSFRGFRDDVWNELAQFDTLVHCSLSPEPFGQVVVEGMTAGIPVIAADAGGPAEIITNNVDGILTPPGDTAALASAMRTLREDLSLRTSLMKEGLLTAAHYTPERTASEIMTVYKDVIDRRR
jgi:glycosyltransferase involved in cell wall biosynthesis